MDEDHLHDVKLCTKTIYATWNYRRRPPFKYPTNQSALA